MMLSGRDGRQQVRPRGGAVDAGGLAGGVGDEGLVQRRERAQELPLEGGQVVDGQLQGPGSGSLQLVGGHASDGGAAATLVGDPVQGVLGGILAVRAQRALVLERAPAAVWVAGTQAVTTGLVLSAVLHLHLGHLSLGHDVEVHELGVEVQVGVDQGALVHGGVSVLQGRRRALHHHLFEVSVGRAQEDDGVVPGGGGGHGGEVRAEGQHRLGVHGELPAQRRVHIQAAEVLPDGLQFREDAGVAGRDEVEAAGAVAGEAGLDVLHELPADGLEGVDAERRARGRLDRHLALAVVALREDGEQHVVLGRDAQVRGQVGAGLADVGRLHQVVLAGAGARGLLALDGDLRVRVVVLVVVAHAHQLGDEGRRRGGPHLHRHEVGEALAGEAVHVVDGVPLPRQRVEELAGARRDGRLRDREHVVGVQRARAHRGQLGPVGRVARVRHAHVHDLRHGRVGRARRDEGHGGRGRVVGHHGLLDDLRHVRDVVQVAHVADALVDGAARDEPRRRVVDDQGLVDVVRRLDHDVGGAVQQHRAVRVVILGARRLGDDQVQVRGQLVQLVDRPDEHPARVLVHHQVVEALRALVREGLDQDVVGQGGAERGEQGQPEPPRGPHHPHLHRTCRAHVMALKSLKISTNRCGEENKNPIAGFSNRLGGK